LTDSWGSSQIITRGVVHHADCLPGFIAVLDGQNSGILTYDVKENMLEIVSLNVLRQREGIGRSLVHAAVDEANHIGCSRLWAITTNDNIPALKFYEALGFRMVAVYEGAIEESRKLKPEIPLVGINDVPITDEIELEKTLS
jgi:GNAT superfamily N-acetyltransferase